MTTHSAPDTEADDLDDFGPDLPYEPEGPYQPLDLSGTAMAYRADPVRWHGTNHRYVYPGRRVVEVPGRLWAAARPEDCPVTDGRPWEWVEDLVLVCPGCGLDGT